jgi:hypothetical protein
VTETRTPFFELPQYSSGLDGTFSRADSNEAFSHVETRAAWDDGVTASSLPSTFLKPGRYFRQSFTDGYALHRYAAAGAWEWMAGTIVPVRLRHRGAAGSDIMISTDIGGSDLATLKAGGEFATNDSVRALYGSAGADLTTDLSDRTSIGRWYVRTRAISEKGLVVAAHATNAGPLITARAFGGADTWFVDALGQMRSSVPAGLGASAPVATVPLTISPGVSDITALDLVAKASGAVPALRAFRTAGDTTPIVQVQPDKITLGRSSWAGAILELRAPNINLIGALDVAGVVEVDSLIVDGAATVGSALGVTGAITGASATLTGSAKSYSLATPMPVTVAALSDIASPVDRQLVHRYTDDTWWRWDVSASPSAAWIPLDPQVTEKIATAPLSIPSGTAGSIPGTLLSLTTLRANAKVTVEAVFDWELVTFGTGFCHGYLFIDNAVQGRQALFQAPAAPARIAGGQQWTATLAAAGTHTFELKGAKDVSGGAASFDDGHTNYRLSLSYK